MRQETVTLLKQWAFWLVVLGITLILTNSFPR